MVLFNGSPPQNDMEFLSVSPASGIYLPGIWELRCRGLLWGTGALRSFVSV